MPFTVITMKKVPNSLRGDLTRWMQELATGVYVGNFNSRVREYLWKRVSDAVGQGEASMCFASRNEIGYSFETINSERQVIDYDGLPLILIPSDQDKQTDIKTGFSDASSFLRARRKVYSSEKSKSDHMQEADSGIIDGIDNIRNDHTFIDIETTGLDAENDQIIEIGAVRVQDDNEAYFHCLLQIDIDLPAVINEITGITDEMLVSEGRELNSGLTEFLHFIRGSVLVGYNIGFDIKFLNHSLEKLSMRSINNDTIDLMREAKKKNLFQSNYKFETTLKEYGINKAVPHRALDDAKLIYALFKRMDLKDQ